MNTKKAAIISFISEYRKAPGSKDYTAPDGNEYSGTYTNEAPLKYLLDTIKSSFNDVEVYLITSKKVDEEKCFNDKFEECSGEEATKTMFDYYEHMIPDYCESIGLGGRVSVSQIPYDFDENIAVSIYDSIKEVTSECSEVYIENTGGLRDAQYLIAALIRYLEMKGVECKAIVYSNFYDEKIYDIKYIYDTEKVTDAVNDFKETGAPNKLIKLFADKKDNEQPMPLLYALRKFNHALALGELGEDSRIKEVKNEVSAQIKSFEESKDTSEDLKLNMLYELLPEIKKSLHIEGDKTFGYPEIVKWCVEHRFLQQAITIYIDKFPEIYCKEGGIGSLGLTANEKRTSGALEESDIFYTQFWDSFYNTEEKRFEENVKDILNTEGITSETNLYNALKARSNKFTKEERQRIKAFNAYLYNYSVNSVNKRYGLLEAATSQDTRINTFATTDFSFSECLLECKDPSNCANCKHITEVGTFEKKVKALEYLKKYSDKDGGSLCELIEIMDCYLILKAIRNRVNHAGTIDEDKQKAIDYFKDKYRNIEKYNLTVDEDDKEKGIVNYRNVKSILLNGAELTANIDSPLIDKVTYDKLIST